MTINLLTAVPSGMVLLADSMLTLRGEGGIATVTTFESAEKLIDLCRAPVPAAALISGPGNVNLKLVSSLLRSAGTALDEALEVGAIHHADVVTEIHNAIDPEWQAAIAARRIETASSPEVVKSLAVENADRDRQGKPKLDRVEPRHVGIVNAKDNDPEAFVWIKASELTIVVATYFCDEPQATELWWPGNDRKIDLPGLRWWGSGGNAVSRLVLGFDMEKLKNRAEQERADRDRLTNPQEPVAKVSDDAERAEAYALEMGPEFVMGVPLNSLPLQAAIEFTEFLGTVACRFDQFTVGQTTVGGPLDVLVLRSDHREWVRKKEIHTTLV